jgi:hypothetical protein
MTEWLPVAGGPVDLTDERTRLYDPPSQTPEWIAQPQDAEPVPLLERANLPADR